MRYLVKRAKFCGIAAATGLGLGINSCMAALPTLGTFDSADILADGATDLGTLLVTAVGLGVAITLAWLAYRYFRRTAK